MKKIKVAKSCIMKREFFSTMYLTKGREYKVWIADSAIVGEDEVYLYINIEEEATYLTLFKGVITGETLISLLDNA